MQNKPENQRINREKKTIKAMLRLYCGQIHGSSAGMLCETCQSLESYAMARLDGCPYGALKPACTKCPIHCYRPKEREDIRKVMRFSGPRMLTRHPYLAVMHILDTFTKPKTQSKKPG